MRRPQLCLLLFCPFLLFYLFSLFSPFLLGVHDYVYAISSFPPWLLCTTQNRCAAVVGASTTPRLRRRPRENQLNSKITRTVFGDEVRLSGPVWSGPFKLNCSHTNQAIDRYECCLPFQTSLMITTTI